MFNKVFLIAAIAIVPAYAIDNELLQESSESKLLGEKFKKDIVDANRIVCAPGVNERRAGILRNFYVVNTNIYAGSDVYVGGVLVIRTENGEKGIKDGEGINRLRSGDVFIGGWKNDTENGEGVCILKNGGMYVGRFENGRRQGKGMMIYAFGGVYEGDWKNDVMEGKGKFVTMEGDVYEGDFKNDVREGKGKVVFVDGDVYEGDYKNNVREGKGKMAYTNGEIYEGDWKNDAREGKGKYVYVNGDVYEGDFAGDLPNGEGTYVYANGCVSKVKFKEGKFKEGKMVLELAKSENTQELIKSENTYVSEMNSEMNKGKVEIFRDTNGDIYIRDALIEEAEDGIEKGVKEEGKGVILYANKNVYVGDWKNNLPNGNGKVAYADGDVCAYVGEFKGGLPNGEGKVVLENGNVYVGRLVNGDLNGECEITYSNGDVYRGLVVNGLPNGEGIIIYPNGTTYRGSFVDGKKDGRGEILNTHTGEKLFIGYYRNGNVMGRRQEPSRILSKLRQSLIAENTEEDSE
ncbi:MAG: hypothetical protein LBG13_02710 [Holosporales bacterium]|jgi:hypothetical protein|nr:hypothetical protein [Holosporales bacterium]